MHKKRVNSGLEHLEIVNYTLHWQGIQTNLYVLGFEERTPTPQLTAGCYYPALLSQAFHLIGERKAWYNSSCMGATHCSCNHNPQNHLTCMFTIAERDALSVCITIGDTLAGSRWSCSGLELVLAV
jgi:hypothetical protein